MFKSKRFKIELIIAILGILSGIGYFLLPLKYFLLVLGGVIGTVLVFWKLEIGIFSVVFLLPFFSTMGIVGLTILIVLSFLFRLARRKETKLKHGISLWILIFAGTTILYSITSVTPGDSIKVAAVILSYLALYFVVINTVTDKKTLYWLVITLIASASLESLYGIYQYKIGVVPTEEGWTDPTLFPDLTTRVFGNLDNPNILAQYLEFIIPLAFGLFWTVKSYAKKAIFLGSMAVMLLCLIFTFSRGGWIAFALSIIVFAILKDRRILLLGAVLSLVSVYFLPQSIIERLLSVGNLNESSNAYRTFIWASTINMIKDYWYSGVGLGVNAFEKLYNAFYIREGVFAFHSHNLYLEILAETGVIGMFTFLGVIFSTFRNGITALINTKDTLIKTIVSALLGGMVAFMFHGISENSFYNFKIVFMFWFVVSLVVSIKEMQPVAVRPVVGEHNA